MSRWHKSLQSRFTAFPPQQQLLMVANELNRAEKQISRPDEYRRSLERATELIDLICTDPRWQHALRELRRAREIMAAHYISKIPASVQPLLNTIVSLHPESWKMLQRGRGRVKAQ
ncbi:hypothetical protein GF407_04790 [candidate division KSB1 bacterium]|nr:hypothetical protein [candidate division KSB1 bacterium]